MQTTISFQHSGIVGFCLKRAARETGLSCDGLNLVYSCIKPIPFLTQEIRMAGPYALAGRDRPGQCCGRAAIDDTLKVL